MQPGSNERSGKTSPWPLLVALGFAAAEIGVFFGIVPVAVGGVLLFGGSCAGIVHEAGYATTPWSPLALIGGVCSVLGGVVWVVRAQTVTVHSLLAVPTTDGLALRGVAILVAGVLLVLVGGVGHARGQVASYGRW